MRVLFVHQNFPAQYGPLAAVLGRAKGFEVKALAEAALVRKRPAIAGVKVVGYETPRGSSSATHHYVRPLEAAVRRGQTVLRCCVELHKRGFVPDVIYAHPGWGEALFLKDVFPKAQLVLYCEFYYHANGADVGFDPEFPSTADDVFRVRVKNATQLLALEAADGGISPTQWQRDRFPAWIRDRISVIHEGVDTDTVCPRSDAALKIPQSEITLTAQDEVVTYIARNLEPYRGFHIFMRAIPEIQRRRPRAQIVIVGGAGVSYGQALPKGESYKQNMLDEIGASIDSSRLHFLGTVPYPTLLEAYRISSAHVYLTYPFVLSWSLLEAMSAGGAVIASRTAPVEEVITDRVNGFLVDFFKPGEIAERVDNALERTAETRGMREHARQTIVERYDLRRVCLPRQLELLHSHARTSQAPKLAAG